MAGWFYFLVNEEDLPLRADVKCPALGQRTPLVNDTVSLCDILSWIAEDGIVKLKRFGELLVHFRGVATGGKVGNIELAKGVAALTERLALRRSAAGECLWIPRDHHRLLSPEIRQLVALAV